MEQHQESLSDLLHEAFAEGVPEGIAMQECFKAIRSLSKDEHESLGVPYQATELQLFEFVMRAGGASLLALENRRL